MPVVRCAASHPRAGWPQLTGTSSQIQWADEIRERLISGIGRNIRSGQGIARTQAMQSTREWLLSHTDARWWIENRNYKPSTVKRARYAEIISIYGSLLGSRGPRRQVQVDGMETKKPPMRAV